MTKDTKMLEAASDIFDTGITAEELYNRKVSLARVLDLTDAALEKAEEAGNEELADKLRAKRDYLQELFDRADEDFEETEPADGDGKASEGESDKEGPDKEGSEEEEEEEDEGGGDEDSDKEKDGDGERPKGDSSRDNIKSTHNPGKAPEGKSGSKEKAGSKGKSSSSKQINPFAKKQPAPPGSPPPPEDQETVFEAAKRILSTLAGEAKRGAAEGLKDLLSKRGFSESLSRSSLQEDIKKTLSRMTEKEFNDELASTMDLVDEILEVEYSDDLEARIAEIKRDISSATTRMELEKEDTEHTKDERAIARANERENAKYKSIKGLPGLEAFRANLHRTVKEQVIAMEDDVETWAALDRRHEDDPSIIKKGYVKDDVFEDDGIPTINVYFDQSGSWSNGDIEIGKRAISVINDFHEKGEIKLQIFYMSAGGIFTSAAAARADGRAEGWRAALDHIKASKVKNVIILSDDDLDSFEWSNRPTGNNGVTRIDGCVWWLWKDSSVSKKALKELIGRSGNFQYQFKGAPRW
jgi:hypothetical protein